MKAHGSPAFEPLYLDLSHCTLPAAAWFTAPFQMDQGLHLHPQSQAHPAPVQKVSSLACASLPICLPAYLPIRPQTCLQTFPAWSPPWRTAP